MNYKIELSSNKDNKFIQIKDFNDDQNDDFDNSNFSEIEPFLNEFCANPRNLDNLNTLIEAIKYQSFPVHPSFFIFITSLLKNNINTYECISLLETILHFPIEYFINSFPIDDIVETIYNFIDSSSEAISILTFFLQNTIFFLNIDEIFLKYGVIQKVEEQLENNNQMIIIQSLIFFRYLLKTKLPFLDDIMDIYNKISKIAITSLNSFSIHTLYHFAKRYIMFNSDQENDDDKKNNDNKNEKENKNKRNHKKKYSIAKYLVFPDLFSIPSQSQINNENFLLYLMKFYYMTSKIQRVYHYNSTRILNILPLVFSCLQSSNTKIVNLSLLFIYNILRDGKNKAYKHIKKLNPELMHFLLQNYKNFCFFSQKEIVFIFIEYSYYLNADELNYIFENFDMVQIFSEIGLSNDLDLLEDFCLCFLNIYDTFMNSNQDYLKYFRDENFVIMIQSLDQTCSSYYSEFYEALTKILSKED